jgi:hypothetical protein
MTNFQGGDAVPIDSTPFKILEFGLDTLNTSQNFVELITTVGWQVTNVSATPPDQPIIFLQVRMDGNIVGSAVQESISNNEDEPLRMVTTFQTSLSNVSPGFHVIQVFASNPQDLQGDVTLTGPVNITGKVIA